MRAPFLIILFASAIGISCTPPSNSVEEVTQIDSSSLIKDKITITEDNNSLFLPHIHSLTYFCAPTTFEQIVEKPPYFEDSLVIFLNHYKKQPNYEGGQARQFKYPNWGKLKRYYVRLDCHYDSLTRGVCRSDQQYSYGLLILYDSLTRDAKVINVDYYLPFDSEVYNMSFSIGSNHRISLSESSQTEGEGGMPEDLSDKKHIVRVSLDGTIIVAKNDSI